MKRFILALIGISSIALMASPASSEENVCGKRNDIISRLENGYQEFNSAMGVSTNGSLVELYTSENGTWTLMLTRPDGVSCLIAAGQNWEAFDAVTPASQTF
ncbi:MAG: hypothetical protein OEY16_05510 [Alphaproteobacteria bacterium]|jgi:hypothetical protein|nr:hypothetical protein [Alphaproteobacteria bacterium]